MTPLRKIEQALQVMLQSASEGDPIDLHELGVIARQIGAQAEMQELGLTEGEAGHVRG